MKSPDTKWLKEFQTLLEEEFVDPKINSNGDLFLQAKYDDEDNAKLRLVKVVQTLLSSRDTYWKERVRKAVEELKRPNDFLVNKDVTADKTLFNISVSTTQGWNGALDTLLDNLK